MQSNQDLHCQEYNDHHHRSTDEQSTVNRLNWLSLGQCPQCHPLRNAYWYRSIPALGWVYNSGIRIILNNEILELSFLTCHCLSIFSAWFSWSRESLDVLQAFPPNKISSILLTPPLDKWGRLRWGETEAPRTHWRALWFLIKERRIENVGTSYFGLPKESVEDAPIGMQAN